MIQKEKLYEMFPQWDKCEIDIIAKQYDTFEEVYSTLIARAVPDEVLAKFLNNEKSTFQTAIRNSSTNYEVPIQTHTEFLSEPEKPALSPLQYSYSAPKLAVTKAESNTAKFILKRIIKPKNSKEYLPLLEKN